MSEPSQQQEVTQWFDTIYQEKGFSYLRPVEAYHIFPSLMSAEAGKKHLDVACGLGLMLKVMTELGAQSYGVDISKEAVIRAKKFCPEANIGVANAEELPYEDGFFDYVTCLGSLERMIDRKKAIQEQMRVANTSATFCYMVRNSEHFIWRFFLKPLGLSNKKGHQDAMNLAEWTELFESCGLKIKMVTRDHWPTLRFLRFISPFIKINTYKPRNFLFPLKWSYEYIFIMEKK